MCLVLSFLSYLDFFPLFCSSSSHFYERAAAVGRIRVPVFFFPSPAVSHPYFLSLDSYVTTTIKGVRVKAGWLGLYYYYLFYKYDHYTGREVFVDRSGNHENGGLLTY